MMKIAVSGKGGTGKTTISVLLSLAFAKAGQNVIAIDADSNANLAYYLGVEHPEDIIPLSDLEEEIEERTGAKKGSYGAYFQMNPKVHDLPEKYCTEIHGIKLLTMGSVTVGGTGCVCPEYVLMKNLVAHMLLNSDETLVLDMEAGLEHFGRGVTASVDLLLVAVNADKVSTVTAGRIEKLAKDIGIKRIYGVGSRVKNNADRDYISKNTPIEILGYIPYNSEIEKLQKEGKNIFIPEIEQEAHGLRQGIENVIHE